MPLYPLVITFADVVVVGGEAMRVSGDLAVLAELQGRTWTLRAVSAGGTEGRGTTLQAAYADFRKEIREVVEDSTHCLHPGETFEYNVRCVFGTDDAMVERLWHESLKALRSGKVRAAHGTERLPRRNVRALRPIRIEKLPGSSAEIAEQFGRAA